MKNSKLILLWTFVVLSHSTAKAQDTPAIKSSPFTILWESRVGSGLVDIDFISARSITESSDGGILATSLASNGTRTGVVKIDKSGNEAWKVIYGNPDVSISPLISFEEEGMVRVVAYRTDTPTGNTGYLYQSKITNAGDTVWSYFEYSAEGSLLGYPFIRKLDDGYIACYSVISGPGAGRDIALVKMSPAGKKIWEERYSVNSYSLKAIGLVVTQDGGFAILADNMQSSTSGISSRQMVIKTKSDGKKEWEKTFDNNGIYESGRAIAEAKNGLFILSTRPNKSTINSAFIRYLSVNDADSWEKEITMDEAIDGTSLCVLPDETIIVGGYSTKFTPELKVDVSSMQFFLAAFNKTGEVLWKDSYGTEGIMDILYSIIPLKDGSFAVAGGSENKMYVAKLAMSPTSVVHESPANQPNFTTSPNPVQNSFTVRYAAEGDSPVLFTLCDGFGRTLEQKSTQGGNAMVEFSTEHLPNGVYFLKLNSGMRTETQKVIIAR